MQNHINRFDKLLSIETSTLLIIDIQEKILPVIHQNETVVENTIKLIKGFRVLGLPIYYTEQYPKGLGETVSLIKDELESKEPVQKLSFSCSGAVESKTLLLEPCLSEFTCDLAGHEIALR